MLTNYIQLAMANFGFVMFFVATLMTLIHKAAKPRSSFSEITYRWFSLFPLGFGALYAFYMHAFFPIYTATLIGWISSPFQYVIAIAYLAFGMVAIFSFNTRFGFRLAAVLANMIWLWGRAGGQIYQMFFINQTVMMSSINSWLWLDIALPIILLLCLIGIKKREGVYR